MQIVCMDLYCTNNEMSSTGQKTWVFCCEKQVLDILDDLTTANAVQLCFF